jgi:membrane-bound acyltransferase YfiQ involved in biofilm formation
MVQERKAGTSFQPNLMDKTVWEVTKLDEISRPAIYVTKVFIACALGMNLFILYGLLLRKEIINSLGLDQIPAPWWIVLLLLFGICYIPVHLATHSAAEIEKVQLARKEQWAYIILGLFLGSV